MNNELDNKLNNEIELELSPPEILAATPKKLQTLDETISQEDNAIIKQISNTINLNDATAIMQYGAPVQNKISKFSDNMLQNIRTKDTGEVGKDLSSLVSTIKGFDSEDDKKPLFGFLRGSKNKIDKMVANFSSVESNIDKVVRSLEGHQRQLLKDVNMLDTMYANNYEYFKELSLYVAAGEQKLEEYKNIDIVNQQQKAENTDNQMEVQKLNDMINHANRFEKKLHDLKMSKTISVQMAPQIRLIQNNNNVLIEKIQSSIVNSIPLWKNQIVIALGIANSQSALRTQKEVTDMTNELLLKNSEMLKQGSIEIASEAEKSVVSIETLQKTNANLVDTITGVLEIQKKGSEDRKLAEQELLKIEDDLKQVLMNATSN